MVQSMDLNKMGLMPMSELEMIAIDGGGAPWRWILGAVGAAGGALVGGVLGAMGGFAAGYAIGKEIERS